MRMHKETKLEFLYTFGLLTVSGLIDAFTCFGDKTAIQYYGAYVVPKVIIPVALTLLYLRWAILYPRFLRRVELAPVKSHYYMPKYVLEAGTDAMWFGIDMGCLFLCAMGFYTSGTTWGDAHPTLQFLEKFYSLWAVPVFAILSYLLINKKL